MFIGIHLGLTYAFGLLLGRFLNVSNKDAGRLAILASVFGILPDIDYFIQFITGMNVHRYVAHSVFIGLGISTILVFWGKRAAVITFASLLFLILIGVSSQSISLYFVSFSFVFLFLFAIILYTIIKPELNKRMLFIYTFLPYVSHIIFDLPAGGSAVLFPIPYILTGQIYWLKLDIFPEAGPLPVSFWLLELSGALLAVTVMVFYQNASYKKYSYTALAGSLALLIFYLTNNNYLGLDAVISILITIYLAGVVWLNGKVSFIILNSWAGYCLVNILFSIRSL